MIRKHITRCCAGILFLFMGSIFLRFLTRNIVIEKLHLHNAFTRAVFFDTPEVEKETGTSIINWTTIYPFDDSVSAAARVKDRASALKRRIDTVKEKIEKYTQDSLINRNMFVELAIQYEALFGWTILNGDVIDLGDGYLTETVKRITTPSLTAFAAGFSAFRDFLQGSGIDLLYVQAPHKIAPDDAVSGITDFSNENADGLISALSLARIPCLDLRNNIREERLDNHRLFYKTDHHWKAETGLWASAILMNYLNEHYGFTFDPRAADPEQYRAVVYNDWFLGSLGKKVTLARTPAEDFTLLLPLFDTDVSISIPELNIDARGDFDVLIDHRMLDRKDYYGLSPYGAYVYGDKQLVTIHNNRAHDGGKILLIKDSFAEVVSPFLGMGVEELHILDLRHFNGSVRAYIAEYRPDIVVVLYDPAVISLGHEEMFDFR